ncbi:MAG: transglycosylase domain-containing protein [Candidatus Cloacimonetes bacterium]|nr:transglycosylase domain-containing protein [Candidatus Cloacimonadota bacterium]
MNKNRILTAILLFVFSFFTAAGLEFLVELSKSLVAEIKALPSPTLSTPLSATTQIFSQGGPPSATGGADAKLIYEIHGDVNRQIINIDDCPNYLLYAFLTNEDQTFFQHLGFSTKAIIRAAKINFATGEILQGGSTITQQLARSLGLSAQKTFARKLKELFLSLLLEAKYEKREILERYFNEAPMGFNLVGVGTGAKVYFGKRISEVNLAESVYLAALVNAPTKLNPYTNRVELTHRAAIILGQMRATGIISQEEFTETQVTLDDVIFLPHGNGLPYPFFAMYVREILEGMFGANLVQTGGLKVETTLDSKLQDLAEQVVAEEFAKIGPKFGADNAALLAVNPQNGEILAMVGGLNFTYSQVNLTCAPRQPGSSIKPLIYVQAFEQGYSPKTAILDEYENFGGGYIPTNYGGKVSGDWVTVRRALTASLNIPAVRTLRKVGIDAAVLRLKEFGLEALGKNDYWGLSLGLGAAEIPMLQMAQAYSIFPNEGQKIKIKPILKVTDSTGEVLLDASLAENLGQVADPVAVAMVNSVLSDYKEKQKVYGTGTQFKNYTLADRPVAGKTGTSSGPKDTWLIGYTSNSPAKGAGLLTLVWVGRTDGKNLRANADGINLAAPIWHAFMEKALSGKPVQEFVGYQETELAKDKKWIK